MHMLPAALNQDAPGAASVVGSPAAPDDARLRGMFIAHFDFIWRSLRRFGLRQDAADDVAQQVFVIAARKLDSILPGSERSFLLRTAMNVASDVRRSAPYRREVAHEDPGAALQSETRPDELLEQWRARLLLDRVLDGMDLELRSVFVLFEIEEMTTAEIAALLGIPHGTAASRLRRARGQFEARLAKVRAERRGGA